VSLHTFGSLDIKREGSTLRCNHCRIEVREWFKQTSNPNRNQCPGTTALPTRTNEGNARGDVA
jgi:hypothetical protein